jgi:hypothetical protein
MDVAIETDNGAGRQSTSADLILPSRLVSCRFRLLTARSTFIPAVAHQFLTWRAVLK